MPGGGARGRGTAQVAEAGFAGCRGQSVVRGPRGRRGQAEKDLGVQVEQVALTLFHRQWGQFWNQSDSIRPTFFVCWPIAEERGAEVGSRGQAVNGGRAVAGLGAPQAPHPPVGVPWVQ